MNATATELTYFFLARRGRCFDSWTTEKIYNYVLVNLVCCNVFAARDRFGQIALVAIAWLDDAKRIKELDARGEPQFDWGHPKGWTPNDRTPNEDSILIADVAGDRSLMPEILSQVKNAWSDAILRKRLFTYRRRKLVELSWETVFRFCRSRRGASGAATETLFETEPPLTPKSQMKSESPDVVSYANRSICHLPSSIFSIPDPIADHSSGELTSSKRISTARIQTGTIDPINQYVVRFFHFGSISSAFDSKMT